MFKDLNADFKYIHFLSCKNKHGGHPGNSVSDGARTEPRQGVRVEVVDAPWQDVGYEDHGHRSRATGPRARAVSERLATLRPCRFGHTPRACELEGEPRSRTGVRSRSARCIGPSGRWLGAIAHRHRPRASPRSCAPLDITVRRLLDTRDLTINGA
jgi:hypothetical protein